MPDLALSIVLGIALAAATGFRVFLPMLIVSGSAHTGHLQLDNSFAWLGTPSALTMLGVAAFAEVLAYSFSYRQPARRIGYTCCVSRRHGRISSGL